ncbi:hypothetical protein CEXT_498431 [Caerostris extrusa]|uniref:Uncharacterized protein n=1 Tax=Caerostris extrusa TaxID=172846 RepID=A0AAV4TG86_CAEEX|nr:hypothetical protein CEXT_498431 [Caerostris extrusa]
MSQTDTFTATGQALEPVPDFRIESLNCFFCVSGFAEELLARKLLGNSHSSAEYFNFDPFCSSSLGSDPLCRGHERCRWLSKGNSNRNG